MPGDINPVFFTSPSALRKWFDTYHNKSKELWIGYHKVSTGLPGITWPESVKEALCYGWIDGIRKSIDDKAYMIRFTPRRTDSIWSAVNLKYFDALRRKGRITPAGQAVYDARKEKHVNRYSFEQGTLELPAEYRGEFKSNNKAWNFFQTLSPTVRKSSIWYVMSAKREVTQRKRLTTLISCSEEEKRIPPLRRG